MDWITMDMFTTVAGAAFAVALVTTVVKKLLPAITGRITQLVALVMSMAIAAIVGTWSSPGAILVSFLNGLVIWSVAVGMDQAVNYKKTPTG